MGQFAEADSTMIKLPFEKVMCVPLCIRRPLSLRVAFRGFVQRLVGFQRRFGFFCPIDSCTLRRLSFRFGSKLAQKDPFP